MIIGEVNLIDIREAGSEELRDGSSHVAAVQIQFPELPKGAGLVGNWTLNVEVSHMQICDNPIARCCCIICNDKGAR